MDEPETEIDEFLKRYAKEQKAQAKTPPDLHPVERRMILDEVRLTLRQSPPEASKSSFWLWRVRLPRIVAIGGVAVVAITAVFFAIAPWRRSSESQLLALQWPTATPFDPSAGSVWVTPQTLLPKGMPDFGRVETLGAPPNGPYIAWQLATVIVRSEDGFGSGAVVSGDGWILSNYHVVADAAQKAAVDGTPATLDVITARTVDGRIKPRSPPLKAKLYRADPRHDLALLKLDSLPEDTKQMPHFELATGVSDGEKCFVIGSQHNGPAWWVRSGNVSQQFDYPGDLSQFAAGVASAKADVERTRATVIVTDAVSISGGDSGGPLLNAKGELIGLTFATSANLSAGSVGWHIGLKELREFMATLPSRPEGVPLDPWTAGLPEAVLREPQLTDADGDGRIDSLRYPYTSQAQKDSPDSRPRALAQTIFVDFNQRTGRISDPLAKVPAGLWGMEERGGFRFNLLLLIRADSVTGVGYATADGLVDEIRVGRSRQDVATVIWLRDKEEKWRATKPTTATPMLDTGRIGESNLRRLRVITGQVLGTADDHQPSDKSNPPASEDNRNRGPNKL